MTLDRATSNLRRPESAGSSGLFRSFLMGGFECSTHRYPDGRHVDVIAWSKHDTYADQDYRMLAQAGLLTARDGLRWHLVEMSPARFDFSSVLPQVRAARDAGVQVIWDIMHYGYPDWLDPYSSDFIRHYAMLAQTFARVLQQETDDPIFFAPVNEPSFYSWAAGEVAFMLPARRKTADQLKEQLLRAAIAGMDAVWEIAPTARFVHTDPLINVIPSLMRPHDAEWAAGYTESQFSSWDILAGIARPEIGGHPRYLDILGLNYYPDNQWIVHDGERVRLGHPRYKPFASMIEEVVQRYGRPVFIAETGAEDERRPGWIRYIGDELIEAERRGVTVEGVCWYPIVNHPGWANDRHCYCGLWDYCDEQGNRCIYEPLWDEFSALPHRLAGARTKSKVQTQGI